MISDGLVMELKMSEKFFLNTTECLQEEDSSFAPKEGMFSVTYMIAHVADTFDWFMDGMFSPDGFDMNFEDHHKRCSACKSVDDARKWFTEAVTRTVETIKSKSDEELMVPLPEGPVMGGAPRLAVVGAIADHTAHHRGSLAVYARLLGREPKMPYAD